MWFVMLIHGLFTGAFCASWLRAQSPGAAILSILFLGGTVWTFFSGSMVLMVANTIGIVLGAIAIMMS